MQKHSKVQPHSLASANIGLNMHSCRQNGVGFAWNLSENASIIVPTTFQFPKYSSRCKRDEELRFGGFIPLSCSLWENVNGRSETQESLTPKGRFSKRWDDQILDSHFFSFCFNCFFFFFQKESLLKDIAGLTGGLGELELFVVDTFPNPNLTLLVLYS